MLVLKQNAANTVPTPPPGKGTIFLDDSDVLSVKTSDGNVENFPTVAASNSQVVFINGTALSGESALTYDFNTNLLTVQGNVAAGNVLTDNLLYANGQPFDLSDPGGSNTQIQFNDEESFGGSSAFTFNKTTNVVAVSNIFLAGADASTTDFANTTVIVSKGNTGTSDTSKQAIVGEALAASVDAIGVQGIGKTAGTYKGTGVQGLAAVTNSADTGAAVGVRGYSTATHSGGYNIGVLGNAAGSGLGNYAFYVQSGNIGSIESDTAWDLNDNSATALAFNSSGKANIIRIDTTDGAEGVAMSGSLAVTGNVSAGNLSTVGTLSVTGNANAGNISTGGALSVTGNVSAGNISTTGQVNATGNVSAAYFIGNGSQLTGIDATAIQNGTANVRTFLNGNVAVSAGGVANVVIVTDTGINVAGTLNATGNANVNNLGTAGLISATGNVSGGNLTTAGAVVATGNVSGGNLTTAGGLSVTGNANVGNIGGTNGVFTANVSAGNLTTTGSLAVTGNASAGNISTGGALSVTGNASAGNLSTGGALSVTGNANVGNIGAAAGVFTGNISSLNANLGNAVAANYVTVANDLTVLGSANIGGGSGGNISGVNNITANTFTGTLTTAAQPNITSLGTLSSLTVTGNASAGNLSTGGALSVTGNASAGNLSTAGALSVTGNANVGNIGGTGAIFTTLGGSLTTASQPNITSVGTLSSLTVTGTATAGNLSTGGTLSVTGNANVGNLGTAGLITATGNISGGNLSTAGALSVTGNANVGNIGGNNAVFTSVAGTLTTAAQPNITSVGTLSSLAVTGNATAGNVSATGDVSGATLTGTLTTASQPNITSVGTLSSLSVTGNVAAGNLTTTGILSVTGTGTSSIAGNLDMTSNNITNLAEPVNSSDAATKAYVDSVAEGLHTHDSCNAATDGTLATISGGTVTYNNGTAGVGANLVTTGSYTTIDGVTLSDGMRILVKNEANAAHNGIYVRTSSTVLTRATDFDTSAEMAGGDFTFVTAGTLYDNTGWVMTDPVTTVGTTAVNWTQFSGAGTYTAGTGLTLTGTQFSVNASQSQITSVGTLTGLNVNGNIIAANITANTGIFTGNGSGLSALAGGNVTGQVGNALVAGTVYTAAQPNITSVGTLTSLAVTGNASAGNISTGGVLSVTGNANVGNIGATNGVFTNVSGNGAALTALNASNISSGTLAQARLANASVTLGNTALTLGSTVTTVAGLTSVTSTTFVGALTGAATTAGTVTTAAQPNITSVGTLSSLAVTGNASAGNLSTGGTLSVTGNANVGNIGAAAAVFTSVSGNGAALTALNASNISSGTLDQARLANSSLTVNGTSISLGGSGTITANTTQTLTLGTYLTGTSFNGGTAVTATVDATSAATASKVVARDVNGSFAGNVITATSFSGSGASLTDLNAGNLSSGTVPSARLSGSYSISVTSATTAGTVTTAAQPNITSVGTLTSLSVTGNVSAGNLVSTGTVGGTGATLLGTTLTTGANSTAGTITGNWTLSAGSRWNATYADLAEKYTADADYQPGTVLVFGGEYEVTLANEENSHRVAGVVSTDPAYTMNANCPGAHTAMLALQGRVPCLVKGKVAKGDILVAGLDGHAIVNNMARAGTIIGKSLENFDGESGVIEVAVGRF
jgi:hypothetical protein